LEKADISKSLGIYNRKEVLGEIKRGFDFGGKKKKKEHCLHGLLHIL